MEHENDPDGDGGFTMRMEARGLTDCGGPNVQYRGFVTHGWQTEEWLRRIASAQTEAESVAYDPERAQLALYALYPHTKPRDD